MFCWPAMAGMEEVEIHSKSYLVRWINVSAEHTISWSIQPHKKSLNFGIFKHPGGTSVINAPSIHSNSDVNDGKENSRVGNSSTPVIEKLKSIGLRPIKWIGKCEADKISQGTYDVRQNEGGNYALVFDNTFSKQISKTATFVLLTYPSHTPPRSGHQIHHSQAMAGGANGNTLTKPGPELVGLGSTESLRHSHGMGLSASTASGRVPPQSSDSSKSFQAIHTGILHKRRRKRHQGHARRFFSLDFNSSTLSYYHDRNSSALRGAIPLALAAIATNDKTREISIDSGAEIWHLRALNDQDFSIWKQALEKASKTPDVAQPEPLSKFPQPLRRQTTRTTDTRGWVEVEGLVEKVTKTRDTVRQLAQDTDPKYLPVPSDKDSRLTISRNASRQTDSTTGSDATESSREKRSFWKLKPKNDHALNQRSQSDSSSQQLPHPRSDSTTSDRGVTIAQNGHSSGIHDSLMWVLRDLNTVVSEFSTLLQERKRLRLSTAPSIQTRASIESDASEEFFDATDGNMSPLLMMHPDSEDEESKESVATETDEDNESLSGSDIEERDAIMQTSLNSSTLFPAKPKSLVPLPTERTARRTTITAPKVLPPSLISFLRKNVGKDLSTISMPVSANEPTSLLQRAAEQFEYSQLLDKAANATDALERLIYVTAFAISPNSNTRVKERSIRKPFNPMLGETYELVHGDRAFRFISEKVSHRPVQLAYQADSKDWSLAQSPKPTQKFWGKSAEIITEGKFRLTLHSSGEHFSWSPGTSFLRNIIAGEKYVEPVGEMCVLNETTGQKTITTFKTGGMFSGRSEEVTVRAFDTHGEELPLGLQGNWTTSLQLTEHGNQTNKTIWAAGPLVDKAQKHYGFTLFAASLNEITPIEKGKLPPTDTRLRPDQRALEDGKLDQAEDLKAELEDKQRQRRRELESRGEEWRPRFFAKVEGDSATEDGLVWKLKTGKDGYWEERARGEWTGVLPVFKL